MDRNAIVHALIAGNIDVVELLLLNGMSLKTSKDTITPLMWAVIYDNLKSVKYLIEKDANIEDSDVNGWNAFMFACAKGYMNIVKYILEIYPDIINKKSKSKETALMIAADNGKLDVVEYLLDNNASIKDQNINGDTALYIASSKGYFEICEKLIKYYELIDFNKTMVEKEYCIAKEKGYNKIVNLFQSKLKS